MKYKTHYIHKISPSPNDLGPDVDISAVESMDKKSLSAILRKAKILSSGESIREYRREPGKIVVFPSRRSIWWSIILTEK